MFGFESFQSFQIDELQIMYSCGAACKDGARMFNCLFDEYKTHHTLIPQQQTRQQQFLSFPSLSLVLRRVLIYEL